MFECEHCHHTFTKSSNLLHHQRTNKVCLGIRGCELPPKPRCGYCNEEYSSSSRVRAHEEKCAKRPSPEEQKVASILSQKDQEIQQLRTLREEDHRKLEFLQEQIVEYRVAVAKLEQQLNTSEHHLTTQLHHTQSQLERRMDDITQMAKKPRIKNNMVIHQNISARFAQFWRRISMSPRCVKARWDWREWLLRTCSPLRMVN